MTASNNANKPGQSINLTKRGLLQSGALMTAGAVMGCATPGTAAKAP
eukprot:gene8094-10810_t